MHAAAGAWLLVSHGVETYVVAEASLNVAFKAAGVGGGFVWFRLVTRREALRLRFGG